MKRSGIHSYEGRTRLYPCPCGSSRLRTEEVPQSACASTIPEHLRRGSQRAPSPERGVGTPWAKNDWRKRMHRRQVQGTPWILDLVESRTQAVDNEDKPKAWSPGIKRSCRRPDLLVAPRAGPPVGRWARHGCDGLRSDRGGSQTPVGGPGKWPH